MTLTWLVIRNPFIQIVFSSNDRPASFLNFSVPTDFSGDVVKITTLDQYTLYCEILFLIIFLTSARLDSFGVRAVGIRIRRPNGEKPDIRALMIRYAIVGVVFLPLWLLPSFLVAIGATFALSAAALLPWFRRGQFRLALHDILAGTIVISLPHLRNRQISQESRSIAGSSRFNDQQI